MLQSSFGSNNFSAAVSSRIYTLSRRCEWSELAFVISCRMLKIMFCSLYPLDAPICVMAIFSSHRLGYWIASIGLCHPCSYQWREKRSEILVRIFANTNRAETTVALIFHCRLKCQSMKILVALQLHTPCWKFGLLVNCAEMSKQIRGAGFCNGRSQKGWGCMCPPHRQG